MKKDIIIAVVSAIGLLLTVLGGYFSGGPTAVALLLVTVACAFGVYMFYQSPAGEECTPSNPDTSNVASYATDALGLCVPSSCVEGRFLIKGKCVIPTNPPSSWDATATSNTWSVQSNIIGSSMQYDTIGQCGFKCDSEPTCNIATYSVSKKTCALYKYDDSNPKDPAKDGDPLTLIKRPVKKK